MVHGIAQADYPRFRLFDIQHAVLPTRLPLMQFYEELVKTQDVINRKHMGLGVLKEVAFIVARLAMQGQTNFAKMLWKFNKVYNPKRQYGDHFKEVKYAMVCCRCTATDVRRADSFTLSTAAAVASGGFSRPPRATPPRAAAGEAADEYCYSQRPL